MKRIVVIGSSNTDMVVKASHLPAAGETVLGGEFMMNAGGKGANQAVAAARYGGRVTFVGRVGDDMFGRRTLEAMRQDGIDTSCVAVDREHSSGIALISVNAEGENSIVVASGANMALGREDIDRAAEAIHAMGVRNVVITLGGDGSLIYDGGRFEYVDAFRVAAVDTTAAGDTYNGVLACCMAEGQGLVEAAREASAAAAISVTRMGAQTAAPTRMEVKEFLVNRE